MSLDFIPFSKSYVTSSATQYLSEVLESRALEGEGNFTALSENIVSSIVDMPQTLLTSSCTDALEMASMLLDLGPGDEVILPSFTFTSAAIAVAKFGAIPVFVDVDPVTFNIRSECILNAISKRTKAVSILNYAGYGVDLESIRNHLIEQDISIIEDNAHGLGGYLGNASLGSLGDISTQSYHGTKNIHCGEGGSISIRSESYINKAHTLRQKGTNRRDFKNGLISKYTWVGQGSSFLPSELQAAFLFSQLQEFQEIQSVRMKIWNRYFSEIHKHDFLQFPSDNPKYRHTAHIFYLTLPSVEYRDGMIKHLRDLGIQAVSHYEPLHLSEAGRKFGKSHSECSNSVQISATILRLPIWVEMSDLQVDRIIEAINSYRI
jgi:dTDP-4-amino-4,6-dideoxygalactose transaminase